METVCIIARSFDAISKKSRKNIDRWRVRFDQPRAQRNRSPVLEDDKYIPDISHFDFSVRFKPAQIFAILCRVFELVQSTQES